jgi:hypothetical protein
LASCERLIDSRLAGQGQYGIAACLHAFCIDLGMKQQSLAVAADEGAGFEQYRRPTRRDVFLATMNEIVP